MFIMAYSITYNRNLLTLVHMPLVTVAGLDQQMYLLLFCWPYWTLFNVCGHSDDTNEYESKQRVKWNHHLTSCDLILHWWSVREYFWWPVIHWILLLKFKKIWMQSHISNHKHLKASELFHTLIVHDHNDHWPISCCHHYNAFNVCYDLTKFD